MILQKDGDKQANISDVRFLFDSIIQKFPSTRYHLGADADIIMNKTFEADVVKVQGEFEEHLTRPEKSELKRFLLQEDDAIDSLMRRHKECRD